MRRELSLKTKTERMETIQLSLEPKQVFLFSVSMSYLHMFIHVFPFVIYTAMSSTIGLR